VAPAVLVSAVLLAAGMGWLMNPLGLLVAATLAAIMGLAVLRESPLLLYWLVPASMAVDFRTAVQAYDVLVVLLAVSTLLSLRYAARSLVLRLQPLEWRYVLFIGFLFTAFFHPVDSRRFLYAIKLFTIALLAFETARFAVQRTGRLALAWGPALFCGITAVQIAIRFQTSGIPAFKSVVLRTYITDLSWGTSNFVAAVLALCVPVIMFVVRQSTAGSWARWAALAAMGATFGSLLMTSSRGGFVLIAGYYLLQVKRLRQLNPVVLIAVLAGVAALAFSPFGVGLMGRFSSEQGANSIFYRVLAWQSAFDRGVTHLPFGVGAGQGFVQMDRLNTEDPHNYLLTLFSEVGPIGLLGWLWLIFSLWQAAGRLVRSPTTRLAGQTLQATILIAMFNLLFEPTMPNYIYQTLFWWIAGTMYGTGPPADLPVRSSTSPADTALRTVPS